LHNFAWFLLEVVSTELVGCSKTKKQKISLQLFEEKNKKKHRITTIIFSGG
jgi:hypothetical protein